MGLTRPSTVDGVKRFDLLGDFEVVSSDGVGDDEDFPHDGDQGDFAGAMIGFDEAIIEVLQRGRMSDGGPGGIEQGAADERSSVPDFGLPALFSAFVGVGGEPDEGGDLFSGQMAEFWQVGDQSRGDDRTDAAHTAQGFGEAIELPIAGDVTLDRLFDGLEALGERRDDDRQAFANDRIVRQIGTADVRPAGRRRAACVGRPAPSAVRRCETSLANRRA